MQLLIVLLLLLLLTSIQAQQNPCSCSCCTGIMCQPISLPNVYVQNCTLQTCIERCIGTYSQCQQNHSDGYISVECSSNIQPQFDCQCNCCNTGSTTCTPSYIGITQAYSCQTSTCSIECAQRYPLQCRTDQNGITQGTCISFINTTPTTTTTTTTTITTGSWLDNTCRCATCQISSTCSSIYIGVTSASSCSIPACTQACQNKYPSNINQTSGTCLSNTNENTFCTCRCCNINTCINYKINTNVGCTMCDSICRQYSPCENTGQTETCTTNKCSNIFSINYFSILLILIFNLFI